jgi:predicted outer membrane repeat protein
VQEANAFAGADIITLGAATYTLSRSTPLEDLAASGDLDISDDLTFNGLTEASTIIDGNGTDRILHIIGADISVTLNNLTLKNGNPSGNGGAIYNEGALTLDHVTLDTNTGSRGGAVYSTGPLAISNSTVQKNTANNNGGGIHVLSSNVVVDASTFTNNQSTSGLGGGLSIGLGSGARYSTIITNATFSGNSARYGGGLESLATTYISGSTFQNNQATNAYGGAIDAGAPFYVSESIIDGNSSANSGGGIATSGSVFVLATSMVSNNTAPRGGGIYVHTSATQLSAIDSTIKDNSASLYGGGLYHTPSTGYKADIRGTLFDGNTATYFGGAIYSTRGMDITNSTLSGNNVTATVGTRQGGGIYLAGASATETVALEHVTVADNGSTGTGDNLAQVTGILQLHNSIVANPVNGNNCDGAIATAGYNLYSSGTCFPTPSNGDISGDPLLLALADNGGPTFTRALDTGSPARDSSSPNCAALDQRGFPRDGTCDMGAFEAGGTATDGGTLEFSAANFDVAENVGTATITVTRTGNTATAVSVEYATVDLTTNHYPSSYYGDLAETRGTLSWAAGEGGSKTFDVVIHDETDPTAAGAWEDDETFKVVLFGPTGGATLGANRGAKVTILANDYTPGEFNFTLYPIQPTEPPAATHIYNLLMYRNSGSDGESSVNFAVTGGTATKGDDYSVNEGRVIFVNGQSSAAIPFTLKDDTLCEGTETIQVTLSDPQGGASLGASSIANLNLFDNEAFAGPLQFSVSTASVSESSGTLNLTVTRGGTGCDVTAAFVATNGTATNGADFTLATGRVSLPAGTIITTIPVAINNDLFYTGNRTFTVTLSDPTGGASIGTRATSTVTITEDDERPVVAFNPGTRSVDENAGTVTVTVERTGNTNGAFSVDYALASGGTATTIDDFTLTNGTLNFADGETSKTFDVTIIDDSSDEPNETIKIALSNATNSATIGTNSNIVITINDDDEPPPTGIFQFQTATYTKTEDALPFTVTVTRTGSIGTITVPYTVSGTATSADHNVTAGTLTFTNGVTSQSISVTLTNDTAEEGDETIILTLGTPVGGGSLGTPTTATITILANDSTSGGSSGGSGSGSGGSSGGGGGAIDPLLLLSLLLLPALRRKQHE